MGQLPPAKVTLLRAFLHTGLDYAGPVTLKAFQGRGTKTYKAWIAVFVCFATSAIYIADTISSDCGTNFVGADASLRKNFAARSKSLGRLASLLVKDGTN